MTVNRRRAPASIDPNREEELELYTENTGELYRHRMAIIEVMKKKIAAKKYSSGPAAKYWLRWYDEGAKRFMKENRLSQPWCERFPRALRMKLATERAADEHARIMRGEHGALPRRPSKAAKKSSPKRRR